MFPDRFCRFFENVTAFSVFCDFVLSEMLLFFFCDVFGFAVVSHLRPGMIIKFAYNYATYILLPFLNSWSN